jgi:hypothetical protein
MEQTKIPRGVDKITVLWTEPGVAFVEFSPDGVRLVHLRVPLVEVQRFDRRAGRRRNG